MSRDIENNFYTVKDFCHKNPSYPSESALRALISDAKWNQNKFQSAFKRVGRRVLVDENQFWECVNNSEKGKE